MEDSTKSMILFSTEFIKNNFQERDKNYQCRTWIKSAIDLLDKETDFSSAGYISSEFLSIDKYLSGKDSSSTVVDIYAKISTIETLMKDA